MRKLKLFLAALALLGGSSVVNAQKDVTAQYITNATLSSLTGWTNVNFNTPVSGNGTIKIGGKDYKSYNTVGYATECYEGWSSVEKSEYSLTQKITLPKGNYTLVNYSFFREGQNYDTDASTSRAYLKAGDNQVLVKTLGSIKAAGYANSQAEGAVCFDSKMYRNTLDFTIAEDDTEIEIGVYGTFNTEITKSWMILGKFELIKTDELATMDSPFDVTGYITNSGFEYRDMSGWTLSEDGAFGAQINDQSFKTGLHYGEKWQGNGALTARSMSQTISGLPAGYYKLTANVGGDGTYIDLNGKTVNGSSTTADLTAGYVLSDNEDLTITAGKTAEGTANWIHFDNFKLYFCGDVAAALTTLLDQVSDYEGKIPSTAFTALQTDVANYNQTYSDVDELLAAISAVQALYEAADLLVEPYAAWLTMKGLADALVAVGNDNSEANGTLSSAISAQASAAEAATTSEGIATATSTLKTAMTTYVFAANPKGDGAKFDCTFLMTNPDLTGFETWKPAAGWASEEPDGNSQVMVNDSKTNGDKSYFYEYWSSPAKASGKFALYNAVTLPKGTFSMSCYAFAEDQNTSSTVNGVYFYANDTEGSCVTATKLTQQTLSFVNSEDQEVKIGLKTQTGNTRNWMGIGYVELFKVPSQTFVISEDAEYDTTQEGAGDVTLTRTIKADVWNTIWLPFSMNEADLKAAFGADVAIAEFSEVPNTNVAGQSTINFNTMSTPAISANKPVLLKTSTAGTSYTIAGRTIVAGTPTIEGTNFDFAGTTVASTTVAAGDYFIGSNKLWKSTGATTLAGTRAYLKAKTAGEARLVIDGEETSIDAIDTATVNNGKLYNLNGQEVKNAQKGIFIQNGKKVVLK